MKGQDKWADTFPHLYELHCVDPSNPANYFNPPKTQSALQKNPPDQYLTELESILEELDPAAWQQWKGRAAISLSVKDRFGYPLPLFDAFNEARAYVFLKRQGCTGIMFVKPGKKKAPDLLAKDSEGRYILLEAKRIHDSDDEIEHLLSPLDRDTRNVCHGLNDALDAKLRSSFRKAREQLLAYVDERVTRRIVYFSIRIDSNRATHKTRDEIGKLLTGMSTGAIEIVHFIENRFLL